MWPYDLNLTLFALVISTCLSFVGRVLYLGWRMGLRRRRGIERHREISLPGDGIDADGLKFHLREVRSHYEAHIHRRAVHKEYRAQLNASVRSSLSRLAFFRRDPADDVRRES